MSKISSIFKAIIRNLGNDSAQFSNAQIQYFGKTGQAQMLHPYGFGGIAPVGHPAMLFHLNNSPENRFCIPYSAQTRLKNRKSGEVWMHNDITGSSIILGEGGVLEVTSTGDAIINVTGKITINSTEAVTVNAPNVNLNADVSLGSGGPAIARVGDSVASIIFPFPIIATIVTGSGRHSAD